MVHNKVLQVVFPLPVVMLVSCSIPFIHCMYKELRGEAQEQEMNRNRNRYTAASFRV